MNIELGIAKYREIYPIMVETALSIANDIAIAGKDEAPTLEKLVDHQLHGLMADYLEDHDENVIPGRLLAAFVRCHNSVANSTHHLIVNFLKNDRTFRDTAEVVLELAWKKATKEIE